MIDQHREVFREKDVDLEKVFGQVLLNCNAMGSDGLWYGRMGCVLFLAAYDRERNNGACEDLLEELMDGIYSRMWCCRHADLESGLCGMAYGVAWLLHHRLMDGDVNGILEEVDGRIMERDPLRIADGSLAKGLEGIRYYVLYRLQMAWDQNLPMPFDRKYLDGLYGSSCRVLKRGRTGSEMASRLVACVENQNIKTEVPDITRLLNLRALPFSDGYVLNGGLAGAGLIRLMDEKNTIL